MSQALLREIKTTIKNYKLYNYLPVNCRTIGGPISGGKRQERRPCIHLINNMENPSTSARQLLNSDLVIVMTLLEKRNNTLITVPGLTGNFCQKVYLNQFTY